MILGAQLLLAWIPTCTAVAQQTELQRILAPPPPDGNPYYNFDVGGAVAVSDEWAAVADMTVNDATGEVYMYRRTPGGWFFRQRIVGEEDSGFGHALAILDDTLVVGGFMWGEYLGKIWIYEWTGATWTLSQEIVPDGLSDFEMPRFGSSIALSHDVLVVGAPTVNQPVAKAGEVRVYELEGSRWVLTARFRLSQVSEVMEAEYFALGTSVSVSGDTIVAGASGNFGAVYVYERASTGWSNTAILENPSPQAGDSFGASVAISGDTLLIGQPAWSSIHPRPGLAFIYERDAAGSWSLDQEIRASDGFGGGDYGDEFGCAVRMAAGRVFVAAHNGESTGYKNGAVYVFTRHDGEWNSTEDYQFVASKPPDVGFGQVGESLDVFENFVLAGAPGSWDDDGIREGTAYIFAVPLGNSYCEPDDSPATFEITGSEVASDQRLILTVRNAPEHARGVFLVSPNPSSSPFGGHSPCLSAAVARLAYVFTGTLGIVMEDLDFSSSWLAGNLIAGSTWYFQFAHERGPGAVHLDTFTNAIALTFE